MSAVVHMYYAPSSTHVKQIVKLAKGKYVHLDSYEHDYNPIGNFLVALVFIAITTVTISAVLGADPTQPYQPTQTVKR